MPVNNNLANSIVAFMNELVKADHEAITSLINNRVECNEALAQHPTIEVMLLDNKYLVGLLGILNGICRTNDKSAGPICAAFEDNGNLAFFTILE